MTTSDRFVHGVPWEDDCGYSQAFRNLDRVLEHFGADRRQVVDATVLVVDLRDNFEDVAAAHRAYFGEHRPASTALGADELALPGQLVEVGAVVRLDLHVSR